MVSGHHQWKEAAWSLWTIIKMDSHCLSEKPESQHFSDYIYSCAFWKGHWPHPKTWSVALWCPWALESLWISVQQRYRLQMVNYYFIRFSWSKPFLIFVQHPNTHKKNNKQINPMDHFWVLNVFKLSVSLLTDWILLIILFVFSVNSQYLIAFGSFSAGEFHVIFALLQLFPQL